MPRAPTLSPHHDNKSGGRGNGIQLPILTVVVTLIHKVDQNGKVGNLVDDDTARNLCPFLPGVNFTERDDETRRSHQRGTIYPGSASVYLLTGPVNAIYRHEVAAAREVLDGTQRYVRFSVPYFVFWPKSA